MPPHLLRRAGLAERRWRSTPLRAGARRAVDYLITGKTAAGVDAPVYPCGTGFLCPPNPPRIYRFRAPQVQFEVEKMRAGWIDANGPLRPAAGRENDPSSGMASFTSGLIEVRNANWLADRACPAPSRSDRQLQAPHPRDHPTIRRWIKYPQQRRETQRPSPMKTLGTRSSWKLFNHGRRERLHRSGHPRRVARRPSHRHDARPQMALNSSIAGMMDGQRKIFGKTGNFMPDDVVDPDLSSVPNPRITWPNGSGLSSPTPILPSRRSS